jgi:hypothetical protein
VIYDRLQHDEAFAGAFHVAEEAGVQNLRAELVRRSLALLQATTPDEVALATLPGLDCGLILNLLRQHERALGEGSGDRRPRRSDAKEAAARLAKLLERMRAEHKRELASKRKAKAAGRDLRKQRKERPDCRVDPEGRKFAYSRSPAKWDVTSTFVRLARTCCMRERRSIAHLHRMVRNGWIADICVRSLEARI